MEAAVLVASRISQPLEGTELRVIYLVERVCYKLASEDAPQVPMDTLEFMLTPHSMTTVQHILWGSGIPSLSESWMS